MVNIDRKRIFRYRNSLIALLLGLLFASTPGFAATNQNPMVPSWATADPCSLVTQSDAASVMSTAPQAANRHPIFACSYRSQDGKTAVLIRNISPVYFGALNRMGAKPVSGIGDAAYFYNNTVFIEKGGNVLSVAILSRPLRKDLEQAEISLAKVAVGRM